MEYRKCKWRDVRRTCLHGIDTADGKTRVRGVSQHQVDFEEIVQACTFMPQYTIHLATEVLILPPQTKHDALETPVHQRAVDERRYQVVRSEHKHERCRDASRVRHGTCVAIC